MNKKKHALFPHAYDEISLVDSGAAQDAHVLILKRDTIGKAEKAVKVKDKKKGTPCDPKSTTGAKETDPKKKSTRGKNFKEERHPRDSKGRMKQTSADSKSKYGKGGSTKAKLARECKDRKGGKGRKPIREITTDPERVKAIRRKRREKDKVKKSMTTWAEDARVRATLERKAT